MPWCPKCKTEYRDGFKVCADCGTELVDEQQVQDSEFFASKEVTEGNDNDGEVERVVDDYGSNQSTTRTPTHQKSADKANENRSSAWMLIIFGGLGMVLVVLNIIGVIPLGFGNPILFNGVMGGMFVIFFVAGLVSMKNAKFFDQKAESENSLRNTLLEWCKDNLKAEEIDAIIGTQGVADEILYFKRFGYIKEKMNHQFVNLDQEFLDILIDEEIYDSVFGN